MSYQNILVSQHEKVIEIRLNRAEVKNAINQELLNEINAVMDEAEKNEAIRVLVLRGENGVFCTGMDLKEKDKMSANSYMGVLKRLSSISKITVAICEGKVLAGGVGLAAASDIVIATPKTEFGLSEALWGLLPANVTPYLIRRVGFQSAYFMTMTTKNISAEKACEIKLVDICSDDPEKEFNTLNRRLCMLHPKTIKRMKAYFRKMWIITDEMEQLAIATLEELKKDPLVQSNIQTFLTTRKLPWEE